MLQKKNKNQEPVSQHSNGLLFLKNTKTLNVGFAFFKKLLKQNSYLFLLLAFARLFISIGLLLFLE